MRDKNVVINTLLVIIMILVVIACIVGYICFTNDVEITEPKGEEAIFSEMTYPRIDGSTATLPLAEAFKANFTKTNIGNVNVTHSKTHNAYVNLINKNISSGFIYDNYVVIGKNDLFNIKEEKTRYKSKYKT